MSLEDKIKEAAKKYSYNRWKNYYIKIIPVNEIEKFQQINQQMVLEQHSESDFISGIKSPEAKEYWQDKIIEEINEAFKLEGIHYTKEFLLKLIERNKDNYENKLCLW